MEEKSGLTLIRVRQGCFIQRYLLPVFCFHHRLMLLTAPTRKDQGGTREHNNEQTDEHDACKTQIKTEYKMKGRKNKGIHGETSWNGVCRYSDIMMPYHLNSASREAQEKQVPRLKVCNVGFRGSISRI